MSKKEDFIDLCVGTVTIITTNRLVLTGTILKSDGDRPTENDNDDSSGNRKDKSSLLELTIVGPVEVENEAEFITLRLTDPVLRIPGNATAPGPIEIYYEVGDTIRISVAEIVTVGPSHTIITPA
ncbi:hypothetical protein SOV_38610 [Sporomusa ovata DSM 2662]|uniref:Uncharacterized protein n=1 Tax=Sporomusa ovata TaxID=2378 RepID=A0A0U1KSB9_9FIRM|nr:hypothetical protein [Sporomusa ovata]EQB26249.1 hypothetical protein SOV_3c01230 [Sporomusa ovata DSM 2662]CQR70326.1 hypothetical protein SpAn4DRAFT_1295 [Sporomusa ovata]